MTHGKELANHLGGEGQAKFQLKVLTSFPMDC